MRRTGKTHAAAAFTWVELVTVAALIAILAVVVGPGCSGTGIEMALRTAAAVQSAHNISKLLAVWEVDHDGRYPDASTSTDVFRELLRERVLENARPLYITGSPGKVPATGKNLTAANVCWNYLGRNDARGVPVGLEANAGELPLFWSCGALPGGPMVLGPDGLKPKLIPDGAFQRSGLVVAWRNGPTKFVHTFEDGTVPFVKAGQLKEPATYMARTPEAP